MSLGPETLDRRGSGTVEFEVHTEGGQFDIRRRGHAVAIEVDRFERVRVVVVVDEVRMVEGHATTDLEDVSRKQVGDRPDSGGVDSLEPSVVVTSDVVALVDGLEKFLRVFGAGECRRPLVVSEPLPDTLRELRTGRVPFPRVVDVRVLDFAVPVHVHESGFCAGDEFTVPKDAGTDTRAYGQVREVGV